MKKIKINNIIYFIIIISSIILIASIYKAEKNYEEKLIFSTNKKITEAAKECFIRKDCEGKITLQDLYNKEYLEEVINPVTKEVMDKNTCLEFKDEEVIFCK